MDPGILNPVYEREPNKPDVHQVKGMRIVSVGGESQEGFGQATRRGLCRDRRTKSASWIQAGGCMVGPQQGSEPTGSDEGGARAERGGRRRLHSQSQRRPYVAIGIETGAR